MEKFPTNSIEEETIKKEQFERQRKEERDLALELCESHEVFPFPGIDNDTYAKMKADEEEFPEYATPIDELIEKFEKEGIKISFGKTPESGNAYILPANSNDIENDGVFPRQLKIGDAMNEKLEKLINMNKG